MDGRSVLVFAAAAAIGASLYVFLAPVGKKKKRVRKDRPPGLVNLGNTCFVNAILQGIAFLPSVLQWLETFNENEKASPVTVELIKLIKALNSGCVEGDDIICPVPMLNALHSHGWVISSEQQDAHEFFQVLSSTLDEEMGELPDILDLHDVATVETLKWEAVLLLFGCSEKNDRTKDKSVVHRNKVPLTQSCGKAHLPFHGLLASQLVCKQCGTKCPVKFDGYDSLSLSLPAAFQIGLGLEDLLCQFVCSEIVDAVECQGCIKQHISQDQSTVVRSKFIKRLTLGKLPACLCIHIQRTYWHSNGLPYKNNSFIKFPELLDLKPFLYEPLDGYNGSRKKMNGLKTSDDSPIVNGRLRMINSQPGNMSFDAPAPSLSSRDELSRALYRLMAVIVHLGDVNEGHYVTYRRYDSSPGNGRASRWLYTSDELVEPVSRDQVLSCCAYMLFYERSGR